MNTATIVGNIIMYVIFFGFIGMCCRMCCKGKDKSVGEMNQTVVLDNEIPAPPLMKETPGQIMTARAINSYNQQLYQQRIAQQQQMMSQQQPMMPSEIQKHNLSDIN